MVCGHRVVLLRRTLVGLLKDHAVAASHHDATLKNAASSYTTSVDSTVVAVLSWTASVRHPTCRYPSTQVDTNHSVTGELQSFDTHTQKSKHRSHGDVGCGVPRLSRLE